jgi:hypothetical protein
VADMPVIELFSNRDKPLPDVYAYVFFGSPKKSDSSHMGVRSLKENHMNCDAGHHRLFAK